MTKNIKLPLRAKDLSGIPESYHGLYEEQDGEYILAKEIEVEDVAGLKSALQKERDLRSGFERKVKGFEGIDLAEIEAMRTEKAERERLDAERKGEYQKLLKQQQDRFEVELKKATEKATQTEQRLVERIKRQAVTEALAKAGGNVALLTPHVAGAVRVSFNEDGDEVIQLFDGKNPKIGKSGDAMTLDEYVGALREDAVFSAAFAGTGNSGGGPRRDDSGSGAGGTGTRRKVPQGTNLHDAREFNRLQEMANKEGVTYVDGNGATIVAPLSA